MHDDGIQHALWPLLSLSQSATTMTVSKALCLRYSFYLAYSLRPDFYDTCRQRRTTQRDQFYTERTWNSGLYLALVVPYQTAESKQLKPISGKMLNVHQFVFRSRSSATIFFGFLTALHICIFKHYFQIVNNLLNELIRIVGLGGIGKLIFEVVICSR